MAIIQYGVGYDLHHSYGACHSEIATYAPGYEEGGETACYTPGYGFDYTAFLGVIQDPFPYESWLQR